MPTSHGEVDVDRSQLLKGTTALLILGVVTIVIVIGLAVLWVAIASKHGFTGM